MKKLILSLVAFLTLGLTTAKAETKTVTFDFVNGDWGTPSNPIEKPEEGKSVEVKDFTFTYGDVLLTIYDSYDWGWALGTATIQGYKDGGRFFTDCAGLQFKVNAGCIIEEISFDVDISLHNGAPDFWCKNEDTWEGLTEFTFRPKTSGIDAEDVKFTCMGDLDYNTYLKKITVTYNTSGEDVKIPAAAPTFYPDRGVVKNKLIINTTIEEGATIYYTTGDYDANAGVEGMREYPVGGITITEPTTITAIVTHPAYENSAPATSSFIPYDPYTAIFDLNSSTWLQEHKVSTGNVPSSMSENDDNVIVMIPQLANFSENLSDGSKGMSLQKGTDITIKTKEDYIIKSVAFIAHQNFGTNNIFSIEGENVVGSNPWTPSTKVKRATFTVSPEGYTVTNVITSIIVTFEKLTEKAPAPTISPESGTMVTAENNKATITSELPNARLYYTTDGTDPVIDDSNWFECPEEFEITGSCVVKALVVSDECAPSEIATATFYHFNDPKAEKTATFDFTSKWFDSWNENYQGSYYAEDDNLIKVEMADANGYAYLIVEPGDADENDKATVKDSKLHIKKGMHITILAGESKKDLVETASSWITSVEFNCVEGEGTPAKWKVQHIENGDFVGMTGNIWTAPEPEIQTRALTPDNKVKSVTFKASDDVDYPMINTVTVKLGGVPTSVDKIEAENDAEAVYYNLQGVRVANPEKGIYIVVKGNKATKQVF